MFVYESVYPFLNEEFIAQEVLNERLDINSIKDKAKKIAILATMFLITASNKGLEKLPSKEEVKNSPTIGVLANQRNLTPEEIKEKFDKLFYFYNEEEEEAPPQINYDILQDPLTLKTSPEGLKFIREHESLRLEAYKLGDGMITIGWGHAEPIRTSMYAVGDKITAVEANRLFKRDIKETEKGIRGLFQLWQGRGLDVKISQHMWDSMISMAYNMGVDGLRGSETVLLLRNQDYLQAADSILTANVSSKFPGLETRRGEERELFLKDLI